MFKALIFTALTTLASLASAAQVATYPLSEVEITYNTQTNKLYAAGKLISGEYVYNSLTKVIVNGIDGDVKLSVDGEFIKAIYTNRTSTVIGTLVDGKVMLQVPFRTFQVSERYDAIEKSFGLIDVDYISLEVRL